MTIDYKLLGERIKQQRMIKGVTQEKFAEYMNVSVGYVSQIERGITKISLERLVATARYLDVSVSYLLEGTDRSEKKYLKSEFDQLTCQLTPYEKKILILLVKEYLRNRETV